MIWINLDHILVIIKYFRCYLNYFFLLISFQSYWTFYLVVHNLVFFIVMVIAFILRRSDPSGYRSTRWGNVIAPLKRLSPYWLFKKYQVLWCQLLVFQAIVIRCNFLLDLLSPRCYLPNLINLDVFIEELNRLLKAHLWWCSHAAAC
jgi:hypothetical protein